MAGAHYRLDPSDSRTTESHVALTATSAMFLGRLFLRWPAPGCESNRKCPSERVRRGRMALMFLPNRVQQIHQFLAHQRDLGRGGREAHAEGDRLGAGRELRGVGEHGEEV